MAGAATAGCKKDGEKGADTATDGCGKDYADPAKQFCITVPAGWKPDAKIGAAPPLYDELFHINGATPTDGVTLTVGFTSTSFKTADEEIAGAEKMMKTITTRKVTSSGATPGESGKWWVYDDRGYHVMNATAKAASGKAVMCSTANTAPSQASIDACKTIRPYPMKK